MRAPTAGGCRLECSTCKLCGRAAALRGSGNMFRNKQSAGRAYLCAAYSLALTRAYMVGAASAQRATSTAIDAFTVTETARWPARRCGRTTERIAEPRPGRALVRNIPVIAIELKVKRRCEVSCWSTSAVVGQAGWRQQLLLWRAADARGAAKYRPAWSALRDLF